MNTPTTGQQPRLTKHWDTHHAFQLQQGNSSEAPDKFYIIHQHPEAVLSPDSPRFQACLAILCSFAVSLQLLLQFHFFPAPEICCFIVSLAASTPLHFM